MGEPTPLELLLKVMRRKWDDGDEPGAVAMAKLAAPYVHGRASASRGGGELAGVPDDELDEWDGGSGEAAAEACPG